MDLFNKKKIKFLNTKLTKAEKEIEELKKPNCFSEGEEIPSNMYLNRIIKDLDEIFEMIVAITNYLGIKIKEEWIDDLRYKPKQIRILRAIKKEDENEH